MIEKYQARYPRIIRSILQSENQYSKGNKPGLILSEKCKGTYCAVCEGDDYWISPLKLQKQITALEHNPTVDISIHPALKLNELTGDRKVIGLYRSDNGIVPLVDIIVKKHVQIPTASTVIRRAVYDKIISFHERNRYLTVGDVYLHIFGAENGGALYLNEVCSVYRQFVVGSWTSRQMDSPKKRAQHVVARIKSFNALKSELPEYTHDALCEANGTWLMLLIKDRNYSISERLSYFYQYHQSLSLPKKLVALSFLFMPIRLVRVVSFVKRTLVVGKGLRA